MRKIKEIKKMSRKDLEYWIEWSANEIAEYKKFIVDLKKEMGKLPTIKEGE